MQQNPICQLYRGGVIVNDGTAKFIVKTVCAKEYVDSVKGNLQAQLNNIQCGIANLPLSRTGRVWSGVVEIPVDFTDTNYIPQATIKYRSYYGDASLSIEVLSKNKFDIRIWIKTADDIPPYTFPVYWVAIHK